MEKYKLKSGNILEVIQDENPESPNSWGNEDMFLVYDHRQFRVEREGFEPVSIFRSIQEKGRGTEVDGLYNNYFIFSVAAYIHSGVSLSLTDSFERKGFDISVTGFILINKERLDDNVIGQKGQNHLSLDQAKELAEGLIETWNQYLSSDVYGFRVIKETDKADRLTSLILEQFDLTRHLTPLVRDFTKTMVKDILTKNLDNCSVEREEIASCWGFYGDNPETNGMLDHIDDEIKLKLN